MIMSRIFSLGYLTIPGTSPVDQIEIAAEAGYDRVSLRTIPMGLQGEPTFKLEDDPALFADVRAALAANGLALNDIELARVREDVDRAPFEAAFERGRELGAEYVISSIWTSDHALACRGFGEICDMAARQGLLVDLEFVPFAGVRNLAMVLDVIRETARPNARILIDTMHAHRAGVTPEQLKAVDPSLFGFCHLCDTEAAVPDVDSPEMVETTREGRLYVGEGSADIVGMLRAMPEVVCSIELPNRAEMERRGAAGHARRCLETARAHLAAHGLS